MAKYPWHQPGMGAPLPWDAQIAPTIATDWSVTMDYADRTHPNLTVWHEHELVRLPTYDATRETMDCEIRDLVSGTVSDENVGCRLYAVGFGRERSAIGSFKSEYFWQSDSLESPQAGCSANPAATISVAICGAGDGALQDFIRVVTGMHSARDLMDVALPYLERQHELEIASDCIPGILPKAPPSLPTLSRYRQPCTGCGSQPPAVHILAQLAAERLGETRGVEDPHLALVQTWQSFRPGNRSGLAIVQTGSHSGHKADLPFAVRRPIPDPSSSSHRQGLT